MNVLYLASIDFPSPKARAIQVISTCHALARAGCHVTLVVGNREPGPPEHHLARYGLRTHPNLRIVGLPVYRLPASAPAALQALYARFWNWSYLLACLLFLPRLLQDGPSVIFARDYRMAWLLGKLRPWHGRRLVFEVHGLPSAEMLDRGATATRVLREASRRRRLEQSVFEGAWKLITITDCLRERLLIDFAVPPERICTVPDATRALNGHYHSRNQLSQASSEGVHEASAGRPGKLIYVGQLYPWKGLDLALRALREVPGAQFTIVGGLDNDPERARLERLARELGLGERVRFAGSRHYAEVSELLAEADVALLPLADTLVGRCFTSPLKLFDYLAAALPIVAVDYPTVREVLRDGENGLLAAPNDPHAFAAAIRRLLDNPDLAARLAAQARRDALSYTWERRAERILSALRGQVNTPPLVEASGR